MKAIYILNLAFAVQIARNLEFITTTTTTNTWMTAEDGAAKEWPAPSTAQHREKNQIPPLRIAKKGEDPTKMAGNNTSSRNKSAGSSGPSRSSLTD